MKKNQELLQELKLRRFIRKALKIKFRKDKIENNKLLKEEENLRTIIKQLLKEGEIDADSEPSPYGSTPVNALADAFNQILPVLKSGLRKLAKPEERVSYRAHVLSKFKTIFDNFEGLDVEQAGQKIGESDVDPDDGGIDTLSISLTDDPDRIMPSDGKEDDRFKEPDKDPDQQLEDDFETFRMAGQNPTGARVAFETINDSNIEQVLSDKRKTISFDPDYANEFKQYAMYNADLWLITFEKELADSLGQQPAFSTTVIPRPSGAKVAAAAQDFSSAPGDTEAVGDIPEFKV